MKKFSILLASLLVTAFIFTGCDDDEVSTGTNNLGKATISGYVYLNYDNSTDLNGDLEIAIDKQFAPQGTGMILKINTNDLAQDGTNPLAADKTYYTTVGTDGKYSFSVDAGAKNVNIISLTGVDVEMDYTTDIYSGGTKHDTVWTQHWNTTNAGGMSVVENDIYFQNLTYSGTPIH